MDTREYSKGLLVEDDDHVNEQLGPGGTVETAVDNLQVDYQVDGVVSGLVVTEHAGTPDMTIDVSTGVAYDGEGKRCNVASGQRPDLSGISLPAAAKEKWVSVFIENAIVNAEPWVDDDGVSGDWEHNDSFTISLVEGSEATPPAARAAVGLAKKRLLADVKLVNAQTTVVNADIDTSRRELCRLIEADDKREIGQDMIPDTDDTHAHGSASKRWSESHAVDKFADKFESGNATRNGAFVFDAAKSYRRRHPLSSCRPVRTAANDAVWKHMRLASDGLRWEEDSYSESNQDATQALGNGSVVAVGQSFTGDGHVLKAVRFYLSKTLVPTGNAVAKIYAHTGTFGASGTPTGSALATSENLDVATLGGALALTTINFTDEFEMEDGTYYFVTLEYSGGDGANYVNMGTDSSSPTHSGNHAIDTGSWSAYSGIDTCFYIHYGVDVWYAEITSAMSDRYWLKMPLSMPDGASLDKVRVSVYQDQTGDQSETTLRVFKTDSAGRRIQIGADVALGSFDSWQTLETAALAETIDNEANEYYAELEGGHDSGSDIINFVRSYSPIVDYTDIGRAPGW